MLEIRQAEDIIKELFASGLISGSTHTCQGQEAVSVGIASVIRPSDLVIATYRGHGHALALGVEPLSVIAEILGRQAGTTGGVGGSMHLSSREVGLMPTSAIIGAGMPIAAGVAWAAQLNGTDDVAISLFGDGASNIGAFHEALNIAAVWKLPVIFICENNLYGEYSRIDLTTAVENIADRASSYDMPGVIVDGQDIAAVIESVTVAVGRARGGNGPTLIEMKTYRYAGHSRSDPATYRPPGELDAWLERDPIRLHAEMLIASGAATQESLDAMATEVALSIEQAVEGAKQSPEAEISDMFAHVTAGEKV
jgi:pyruvate dehydrogenase E1 component alpha subunit